MNFIFKHIITALKGFGMGAANIVPGVSGGTIALLTGIYTELIEAINQFLVTANWKLFLQGNIKEFWKKIHGNFLAALAIGVGLSLISMAKVMEYAIIHHPVQTWAFFFGLIIASSIYMLSDIKSLKIKDLLFSFIGGALGVAISTLSPTNTPDGLWFVFICGAISICTMILPGISGSFILVLLGKYEYIINALNTLNLPVLLVFALGCAIGILAFAKFLHWLLANYERQTMLILIGFVLGSLVKVWPWNDMKAVAKAHFLSEPGIDSNAAEYAVEELISQGVDLKSTVNMHTAEAIAWAIAGLALVWGLEALSKKYKSSLQEKK